MAGSRRPSILVGGLILAALWALALHGLTAVFAAGSWYPRAVAISAATTIGACALRAVAPRLRGTAVLGGGCIGVLIWAWTLVASGRLAAWTESPVAVLTGVRQHLYLGVAPVDAAGPLEDLLLGAVLLLALLTAALLAGLDAYVASGVAVALLLLAPSATTSRPLDGLALVGAGALLALLVWVGSPARRWGGLVAAAAAVAVAAGAVAVAPQTRDRVWNDANVLSPVSGSVPDVTIALADDLRERSTSPAFSYTSTERQPLRFALATLSDFSEGRWQPEDERADEGLDVSAPRAWDGLGTELGDAETADAVWALPSVSVTIEGLVSDWLPLPQTTVQVREAEDAPGFDPSPWLWSADAGTARTESGATGRGDRYEARFSSPAVDRGGAGAAAEGQDPVADPSEAPEAVSVYLELPDGLPSALEEASAGVAERADRTASEGSANRLDIGLALQEWFRTSGFVYDESAPYQPGTDPDDPYSVMEAFLSERRGFCVHYASTFAVMARELGVPTRVVVGYASRPVSDGATTVRGRDLHAWPEIYIDGAGWVAFEPTPGGAGYRADTDRDIPAVPDESEAEDPVPTETPSPSPEPTPEPEEGGGDEPSDAGREQSAPNAAPALWTSLAGLAVLLALATPGLRRRLRASRRFRAIAHGPRPASAAWAELRDTARDLRLVPLSADGRDGTAPAAPRAQTPEALVEHLVATGALQSARAVRAAQRLAAETAEERYGAGEDDRAEGGRSIDPSSTTGGAADALRLVAGELRRSAGAPARIRARLLPAPRRR